MSATEAPEPVDPHALQPGHPRDEYGRPFGVPLWRGGPVLGGAKWREFVAARRERERTSGGRA